MSDAMETHPWTRFYPPDALEPLAPDHQRLTDLLSQAVERHGDEDAVTLDNTTWTFLRLEEESRQVAESLEAMGVAGGDRVAIMLPNLPDYVAALFAVWRLGATVVQINPAYVGPEVARILEHSQAWAVITTAHLERTGVISVRDADIPRFLVDERTILMGTHRTSRPASAVDRGPSEIALLQYTGGTTGEPKAAMLTHRNVLANIDQRLRLTFATLDLPAGAKVVNTLPMAHVFGLTCVTLTCVRLGLNQLIVPRFDPREVLDLIRRERPFAFFGVPTMYAAFLRQNDLEEAGFGNVSLVNSAGAPMPPAQLARFESRTGARVLDGFGMTEASPTTHTNPPYLDRRPGSCGIPVPHTDVRIVRGRDDLTPLPHGSTGELAVRGPQVMHGYFAAPESTTDALVDGWLLSGDLATMDEDGYLYIVGRSKDVIVASGFNVYPAEVEAVIGQIPGVAEVAVVGRPHDYRGETVHAVVVTDERTALTVEEIRARCRVELAPFKVPTDVEFRDQLPRTAVGKIDKRGLTPTPRSPHPIP